MKYRVIKIISDTEILVNAGANRGIKEGNILTIRGKDEEIIDPFSNESLGYLPVNKAQVRVYTVYENMCICKPTLAFKFEVARLNVEVPFQIYTEDDDVIRIGDFVVKE